MSMTNILMKYMMSKSKINDDFISNHGDRTDIEKENDQKDHVMTFILIRRIIIILRSYQPLRSRLAASKTERKRST